jgi:hypothetical protein
MGQSFVTTAWILQGPYTRLVRVMSFRPDNLKYHRKEVYIGVTARVSGTGRTAAFASAGSLIDSPTQKTIRYQVILLQHPPSSCQPGSSILIDSCPEDSLTVENGARCWNGKKSTNRRQRTSSAEYFADRFTIM